MSLYEINGGDSLFTYKRSELFMSLYEMNGLPVEC